MSLFPGRAGDHPIGKGTPAAIDAIRFEAEPALDDDRWYHPEKKTKLELADSGCIGAAVESAIGVLE